MIDDQGWNSGEPRQGRGGGCPRAGWKDSCCWARSRVASGMFGHVCPDCSHHNDPQGATVVDATNKFVMPGGIDSSTHFYRGEDGHKMDLADDWASGSKAAVSGENIFCFKCLFWRE